MTEAERDLLKSVAAGVAECVLKISNDGRFYHDSIRSDMSRLGYLEMAKRRAKKELSDMEDRDEQQRLQELGKKRSFWRKIKNSLGQ
jgi:hypothetical protein